MGACPARAATASGAGNGTAAQTTVRRSAEPGRVPWSFARSATNWRSPGPALLVLLGLRRACTPAPPPAAPASSAGGPTGSGAVATATPQPERLRYGYPATSLSYFYILAAEELGF